MVADQRPGLIRAGGLVFLIIAMAASIALADFCPKCGKEVDAPDNFCRKCGKNLKSGEDPKQEGNKEKGPEQRQSQHQQVVIVIQKDGKTCVKGDQEGTQRPPAPLYQATFSLSSNLIERMSGKLSGTTDEVELCASRANDGSHDFGIYLYRVDDRGGKSQVDGPIGKCSLESSNAFFNKEVGPKVDDGPVTEPLSFVDIKQNHGYRAVVRLTKRVWHPYHYIVYGEFRVYPDSVTIETEK